MLCSCGLSLVVFARGLSPVQLDKPWYNLYAVLINVYPAQYELVPAKVAIS